MISAHCWITYLDAQLWEEKLTLDTGRTNFSHVEADLAAPVKLPGPWYLYWIDDVMQARDFLSMHYFEIKGNRIATMTRIEKQGGDYAIRMEIVDYLAGQWGLGQWMDYEASGVLVKNHKVEFEPKLYPTEPSKSSRISVLHQSVCSAKRAPLSKEQVENNFSAMNHELSSAKE